MWSFKIVFQAPNKDVPGDTVAVINATDLSPILENTQVKEIRELVSTEVIDANSRPVEISIKVAELPTTTPIEVSYATCI